jgi:hypothetical protein
MKRKPIRGVIGWLMCMLIMLCFSTTLSSCNEKKCPATQEYVDQAVAAGVELAAETTNPTFQSVNEVLVFRQALLEQKHIDDLFTSLTEEIVTEVAGVLLKRGDPCTKRAIIEEYNAHSEVYDNLQAKPATPDLEPTTASEEQHRPSDSTAIAGETSFTQKDTIINGKAVKMITKTVTSYE